MSSDRLQQEINILVSKAEMVIINQMLVIAKAQNPNIHSKAGMVRHALNVVYGKRLGYQLAIPVWGGGAKTAQDRLNEYAKTDRVNNKKTLNKYLKKQDKDTGLVLDSAGLEEIVTDTELSSIVKDLNENSRINQLAKELDNLTKI